MTRVCLVGDNPLITFFCWWALKWIDVISSISSFGYYPLTNMRIYESNYFTNFFLEVMGVKAFIYIPLFTAFFMTMGLHLLDKHKINSRLIKFLYFITVLQCLFTPLKNCYNLGIALGVI